MMRALAGVGVILLLSSGVWAQKNKKNQNAPTEPMPSMPMSPNEEIEHDIGEMLAAQQLGNMEMMHKYYSDSATFVSSDYGPPIVGWKNWSAGYGTGEAESGVPADADHPAEHIHLHARGRGVGDISVGIFGDAGDRGRGYDARGQTTLVFTKVGNDWLIVHNHTAVDCGSLAPVETTQAPTVTPVQPQPKPQN